MLLDRGLLDLDMAVLYGLDLRATGIAGEPNEAADAAVCWLDKDNGLP